jgi:hypothetical protein
MVIGSSNHQSKRLSPLRSWVNLQLHLFKKSRCSAASPVSALTGIVDSVGRDKLKPGIRHKVAAIQRRPYNALRLISN